MDGGIAAGRRSDDKRGSSPQSRAPERRFRLLGVRRHGKIAGVSALDVREGTEVYFGAFGMADRNAGHRMTRDAIVQIFSMTKPITGVALMTLYEQGKFALDDPLSKYAPEFANMMVYAGSGCVGQSQSSRSRIDRSRFGTSRAIPRVSRRAATIRASGRCCRPRIRSTEQHTRTDGAEARHGSALVSSGREVGVRPFGRRAGVSRRATVGAEVSATTCNSTCSIRCACARRDTSCRRATEVAFAAMYHRSDAGVLSQDSTKDAWRFNTNHWALTPGSYGLTSTLDDYMRFARMLLAGGTLDGVRVLKPETVKLMATSHLSDSITERSWLPSKGQVGFGIDFAVRTRPTSSPEENHGIVGEFFWDGAASTLFWVDPANQLAAVLFVQLMPFDRDRTCTKDFATRFTVRIKRRARPAKP